jgi:precorrin-6B methylase 2
MDTSFAATASLMREPGARIVKQTDRPGTFETINDRVQYLTLTVRMLAVVGASLKLRSNEEVDQKIQEQIDIGARLALGNDVDMLDDQQVSSFVTTIEMAFAEGGELFRNPNRSASWKVEDANLLQAQGQASRHVFARILSLAETRPLLHDTLTGHFLDVGTGVGGIALEAAETCPDLRIDGIDIWEPALALAKRNLSGSPFVDRVHLIHRDVSALKPGPRYTLVWLPTMFMKRAVLERALDRVVAASRHGSYLVAALYTRPRDPFLAVISALRTLRSGGDIMETPELENMLRSRGYVDVESDTAPLATFVLGRLP